MVGILFFIIFLMIALSGWGLFIFSTFHKTYDGQVVISKNEVGKTIFTLELDIDPEDIKEMYSLSFKVFDQDNFLG